MTVDLDHCYVADHEPPKPMPEFENNNKQVDQEIVQEEDENVER